MNLLSDFVLIDAALALTSAEPHPFSSSRGEYTSEKNGIKKPFFCDPSLDIRM
jgi:hypothetical protein